MSIHKDQIQVLFSAETIHKRVAELGKEITDYYAPLTDCLYMVCVLKGSVHFFSDLLLNMSMHAHYIFIQVSSYEDNQSSGQVVIKSILDESIQDKYVLIVEDILDSGQTLHHIMRYMEGLNPRDLSVATLLDKYEKDHLGVIPRFTGFRVPNQFVIGYGLDYDQLYRNLPYIGYVSQ